VHLCDFSVWLCVIFHCSKIVCQVVACAVYAIAYKDIVTSASGVGRQEIWQLWGNQSVVYSENGEWRMANGEWRMANGEWRMANGEWRMRSDPKSNIENLKSELVWVMQRAVAQGLICSSDGNLSVRLDAGRLLMTPSGCYKATLGPEDLLIINDAGEVLSAPAGRDLRPSSETRLHLAVYRARPDINAVLHAHPPYATALTLAGLSLPVDVIPEVLQVLGDVPTAPYATPGTVALAESIVPFLLEHNALLLSHHGSLTLGATLEAALVALERLEHAAQVYFLAQALGPIQPLPPEEIARLRALRGAPTSSLSTVSDQNRRRTGGKGASHAALIPKGKRQG